MQWTDLQESDSISNLTMAIAQMIHHFEQITFINIEDKEKLSQQLLLHLTPAFYRIKYNLTDRDELINPFTRKLSILISYGETIMPIVN